MKKPALISGLVFSVMLTILISCTQPSPKLGNISATTATFSGKVGDTKTTTISFANTGDAALTYTASETSEALEVTNGSATGTVAPSATATLTLEATCLSTTPVNDAVKISSNGGDVSIAVTLTCTAPPTSGNYNVDVRFIGTTTTRQQKAAFEQAALRWEAVITSQLTPIPMSEVAPVVPGPYCEPGEGNISTETISGLLIFAKVGTIDGKGKVLAKAGPSLIRTEDDTPFIGCMIFDIADIDSLTQGGSFTDVVQHEMGHVIGIGTLWESLLDNACPNSGKVGFTGANAKIEFGVLGETGNPPVESNTGQSGTDCGHWDEGVFDSELMTGFAEDAGVRMPLSKLTIGSLEDLGYSVDYSLADSYELPSCLPNCPNLKEETTDLLLGEQLLYPKFSVDSQGKVLQLNNQ